MYFNIHSPDCQDFVRIFAEKAENELNGVVLSSRGKRKENWSDRKKASLSVANMVSSVSSDYDERSERISSCCSWLKFQAGQNLDGEFVAKLALAPFCKDRFCPTCQWRRSLRLGADLIRVCNDSSISEKYRFLLLTLTVPNCSFESLSDTLSNMLRAWNNFSRLWFFRGKKSVVRGWFRSLEITVEKSRKGFFHPHFHCLLAVPLGYGEKNSGVPYVSRAEFLQAWRDSFGDQSIVSVDVRFVRPSEGQNIYSLSEAVAEVAKYSVKHKDLSVDALRFLLPALRNRRLVALGGVLKDTFQRLSLTLPEDESADLVHVDEQTGEAFNVFLLYFWSFAKRRYEQKIF